MKLSMCVIVKNDGPTIRRMLDSAVGVVDEIVIADTGSTDNTRQLIDDFAQEHPGLIRVYDFEWVNDFAKARNFVLQRADGDWAMVVDADEFLDEQERHGLRGFLENVKCDGVFINVRNYLGTLQQIQNVVDVDVCRVFRTKYRYEGEIHEQIVPDIERNGGKFGTYPLHLHHVGYTAEYLELKQKNTRNLTLLEQQIRSFKPSQRNERWFATVNILAEYAALGMNSEVIGTARLVIEEMKRHSKQGYPNYMVRAYKFYVHALMQTRRVDDAKRICREALTIYPQYTDIHMMLADIHLAMSEFHETLSSLRKCMEIGDVKFGLAEYTEGSGSFLAARKTGYAWMRLGDELTAREYFTEAYRMNQEQTDVVGHLVRLTPDQNTLDVMFQTLMTPQRTAEFLEAYAIAGYDHTIEFLESAEKKWGPLENSERIRFAYHVRHGMKRAEPDSSSAPLEHVWWGLWQYELGNEGAARSSWAEGGGHGEYLLHVLDEVPRGMHWEVKNIWRELLCAKAMRFVNRFAHAIGDLSVVFPQVIHTDMIAAFTSDEFLQGNRGCHEEWEWCAQVWLAKGNAELAAQCLERARFQNDERSVRGYLIEAEMFQSDRTRQEQTMRKARNRYADSKLLSFIWTAHFQPALLKTGVVM